VSTWPSQPSWIPRDPPLARSPLKSSQRRFGLRFALGLACLTGVLVIQGAAITQSYLWAAPLVCLLFIAVAAEIPLVPLIGSCLLLRVLTDDLSSTTSRHSSSVNLSAFIAVLLILAAVGLLLRRRRAVWSITLAALWLVLWAAVAAHSNGLSTLTLREPVREASIAALAVIVCNSRGVLNLPSVTRMVQVAGAISAPIALYQLATHGGQLVSGEVRSNGTFSQPNSAAVFFAVAAIASLWRFVDNGHRRSDAIFLLIFAAATISTFSLGGLLCLLVMLVAFGLLRPVSPRIKMGSCIVAILIVVGFLATPLGAERVAKESSTSLSSERAGSTKDTSLSWRFFKWEALLPEWEASPLLGQGLGTTTTTEGTSSDVSIGLAPHNEYIRYLVETGVVGLMILLAGIALLIRKLARQRAIPDINEAGTLGMAITLGLLVNAIAANTLLYTPAAYAAVLIVAAAIYWPVGPRSAPAESAT
jgi:O-antigen ligase